MLNKVFAKSNSKVILWSMLLFVFCISSPKLFAQYNIKQNNVWAFGYKAGLDFNTGFPVPVLTNINSFEGAASVSDSNGHLLFYSNGDSVWNKNGMVMPNGNNLMPYSAHSCTQGSLIVPVFSSLTQYYLFSLQEDDYGLSSRLYYSIVDMSLNGGLGDIPSSKKSIVIDSVLSEKMIAVAGENCNIWLLVHGRENHTFKAYEITKLGISSSPVISNCGHFSGVLTYDHGVMKSSHDRRKLIVCSAECLDSTLSNYDSSGMGAELYDFNPQSGIVSNPIIVDSAIMCYGACFAPNDSILYLSTSRIYQYRHYIFQYKISTPTQAAIKSSKKVIHFSNDMFSDLKLGPDSAIYLTNLSSLDYLDRINFPNKSDTGCHYWIKAIALDSGTSGFYGFPNEYVKPLCNNAEVNDVNSGNEFKLYPNPVSEQLNIENAKGTTIKIFNLLGQEIYSGILQKEKETIATSHFPLSTYLIQITDSKGNRVIRKIVKQ